MYKDRFMTNWWKFWSK